MAHSGRRTGYTIWPASRYAFTNKQGPRKCGPCSFLRGRATLHLVITYQCSARRLGEPSVGTPAEKAGRRVAPGGLFHVRLPQQTIQAIIEAVPGACNAWGEGRADVGG
jgi:hypothetical protein